MLPACWTAGEAFALPQLPLTRRDIDTFLSVHQHANDHVGHLSRWGEAERLADQAFDTRPYSQMLARNVLRVLLAWALHIGGQMPWVYAPMIGRKAGETAGLQQRRALHK